MALLQDTRIGSALREALSLDGAGQVRLDMADSVVPVVLVGDVTEAVRVDRVMAQHTRNITAVAAQYARAAFEVQANTTLNEVYLRRLHIFSNTTQQLWMGFSGTLVGPTVDGAPQRNRYSVRAAPLSGRMIGDNNATIPSIASYSKAVNVLANETVVVDFSDTPIIVDVMTQGALYVIHTTVVNTTLTVSAEWEEVPRVN